MRLSRRATTRFSRAAALLTAVMALIAGLTALDAEVASDMGVLATSVAIAAALVAAKLWRDNCFESRLVAVLISVSTLVGQLLVSMVGGSLNPHPHWTALGALVCALSGGVLVSIALDARRQDVLTVAEPPYAL